MSENYESENRIQKGNQIINNMRQQSSGFAVQQIQFQKYV